VENVTVPVVKTPASPVRGARNYKFAELIASRSHTRRMSSLEEMARVAVFAASDAASGLTGTTINLAMGALHD
jgi:NAD(P)-dependent dehydrogenase (short-subunit alcohol dehydrogenase family)